MADVNSEVVAEPKDNYQIRRVYIMNRLTAHIDGSDFSSVYDIESSAGNVVRNWIQATIMCLENVKVIAGRYSPQMSQHHRSTEDHSGRVGSVCAHQVLGDVSASRLEQRIFLVVIRCTIKAAQ